jgi:hypothetical protein
MSVMSSKGNLAVKPAELTTRETLGKLFLGISPEVKDTAKKVTGYQTVITNSNDHSPKSESSSPRNYSPFDSIDNSML